MQYTTEFMLPFEPSGRIPVVLVKQGDNSTRFLRITVLKADEKYQPSANQTIIFREEKPDGHGVMVDSAEPDTELGRTLVVLNDDGTITVELIDQMTTCPGLCRCDLCFTSNGGVISTAPFVLDVRGVPDVSSLIPSEDAFLSFVNALENVWKAGVIAIPGATATGYINISSSWSGSDPYTASATAENYTVTGNTTVHLVNNAGIISQLADDGISALYFINTNGALSAVAIGNKPKGALRVPVCYVETETATYENVRDGQIIAYDAASGKWLNKDLSIYGYLTEQAARTLISSYNYLTESQITDKVNQMIEDYIESLDASNVRY